jgi:hypothetical protein
MQVEMQTLKVEKIEDKTMYGGTTGPAKDES